jgi:protein tyrosine phosphatase (PTP) superfamily phosphohydrolase (DUF442 family)
MQKSFRRAAVCLAAALIGGSGCSYCCQRAPAPPAPIVPATPVPLAPAPVAPIAAPPPGSVAPITAPPANIRSYEPPPVWRPAPESQVRLNPPEAVVPEPPRTNAKPPPRETPPPPVADIPSTKPAVSDEGTSTLPVGIPQFAVVEDGVASGNKPLLEGLDWLKQNGYRTILYLHRPGEADADFQKQVEKRGLKFESLEVSPQTLSRATVDQFSRLIGDKSRRPLFVYDKDSVLAGGLWYLHFRLTEKLTEAGARAKALRLGLREQQDGEQKLMWLAIQKLLSQQAL